MASASAVPESRSMPGVCCGSSPGKGLGRLSGGQWPFLSGLRPAGSGGGYSAGLWSGNGRLPCPGWDGVGDGGVAMMDS